MEFLREHILTIVIFFPVLAAAVILVYGKADGSNARGMKRMAIAFATVEFLLSLPLAFGFERAATMQFEVNKLWISAAGLNANYHIGIDGLSLWLVLLSTLITPIALLASYEAIEKRQRSCPVARSREYRLKSSLVKYAVVSLTIGPQTFPPDSGSKLHRSSPVPASSATRRLSPSTIFW